MRGPVGTPTLVHPWLLLKLSSLNESVNKKFDIDLLSRIIKLQFLPIISVVYTLSM